MNFGKIDNYLLFGGGDLLCLVIRKLREMNKEIFVITSERQIAELLLFEKSGTLQKFLENNKVEYIISSDPNTDSRLLERVCITSLGISSGAAWKFLPSILSLFEGRLINLHGRRLPKDRGGGGFSWMILHRDLFGVSLAHQMAEEYDTGPVVGYQEYLFSRYCRLPIDYYKEAIEHYGEFLKEFLQRINSEEDFKVFRQTEYNSSYWPRLSTELNGFIDWTLTANELELFICAFDDPYCGASTYLNNELVRLKKCRVTYSGTGFHPFQSGHVFRVGSNFLAIAAGGGALIVEELFDRTGNNILKMIKPGDRFHTPSEKLDRAKSFRPVY